MATKAGTTCTKNSGGRGGSYGIGFSDICFGSDQSCESHQGVAPKYIETFMLGLPARETWAFENLSPDQDPFIVDAQTCTILSSGPLGGGPATMPSSIMWADWSKAEQPESMFTPPKECS